MSRSKKKTPKAGITNSASEKEDKRNANRKLRRKTKQQVEQGNEIVSELREVSNVWGFDKDGKVFVKNVSDKDLRK